MAARRRVEAMVGQATLVEEVEVGLTLSQLARRMHKTEELPLPFEHTYDNVCGPPGGQIAPGRGLEGCPDYRSH